jgi:hypothetical protein
MVGTRAFLSQITIVLQIGFSWLHLQWSICCGCSRLLSQFLNCEEMHMEDFTCARYDRAQFFSLSLGSLSNQNSAQMICLY